MNMIHACPAMIVSTPYSVLHPSPQKPCPKSPLQAVSGTDGELCPAQHVCVNRAQIRAWVPQCENTFKY